MIAAAVARANVIQDALADIGRCGQRASQFFEAERQPRDFATRATRPAAPPGSLVLLRPAHGVLQGRGDEELPEMKSKPGPVVSAHRHRTPDQSPCGKSP